MTAVLPPLTPVANARGGEPADLHSAVVNRLGEDIVGGRLEAGAVLSLRSS